jgi:predicted aspartyl protease
MTRGLLLAAVLIAPTILCPQVRAEDCHLTMITSLTATWDSEGGIVVPATIDGKDTPLLIDTAGIYNLLTRSAATAIGIEERPIRIRLLLGPNGEPLSTAAVAHSFQLGNIVADKMEFAIIPDHRVGLGASGTLGPNVMANYDVEIDPAHGKVNLFAQDHCPDQAVYWTRTPYASIPMRVDRQLHIIVPVTLDGQVFEATIDTGSSHSWLLYDRARDAFQWTDDTAALVPSNGHAGSVGWYKYPFQSLSLNGVDVRNPRIEVFKSDHGAGDRTALVIGMDVLSKLHTFISYSEHKLYFTGANAPPADATPAAAH